MFFYIISDAHGVGGGFVSATCWIQGFYIFTDLWNRTDETAFFGIPRDIDLDGVSPNGELCNTQPKMSKDFVEGCAAMEKTYFLQVIYIFGFIYKRSLS